MKKKIIQLTVFAFAIMITSCSPTKKGAGDTNLNSLEGYRSKAVEDVEFTRFENFSTNYFDENSIVIDNEWMPMTPGLELTYQGYDINDEDEKVNHKIIYTVTDLTKIINGINAVVLYERDYSEGELEEAELAFFAQDKVGNVWHLGQYYELYEEGEFVGGRMWAVGHLDGAKAGIIMQKYPKTGTQSYSQGYAPPPFNWTDRSKVVKMGERVSNFTGDYRNVLVIEEYNREEPNSFQLKYYAQGIGNIGIGWSGNDESKETMDLVDIQKLNSDELDKVRKEAMQLEKRAYIYATTAPAIRRENNMANN